MELKYKMSEIKKSTLRTLSMLGQRGTLGVTLEELAKNNEKIVALTSDLQNTSGLDRFAKSFPNRMFNTGIAEQNMIGMSAGLASNGYIPFATSFANFTALRGNEFARHFMGYMNENIKLVGMGAGFAMGLFGNTHYALEDIAVLRAIPNLTILSPADCLETKKAIISACNHIGPVYLRLSGVSNNPIVYKEDYEFTIGKAVCLEDEGDIAIIATGSTVYECVKAVNELKNKGVKCQLWNVHTLSSLDDDFINSICKCKVAFTFEEHREIGGLGSLISEKLADKTIKPILYRKGANFTFDKAGTYEYCMKQNELLSEDITEFILNKHKKENKNG